MQQVYFPRWSNEYKKAATEIYLVTNQLSDINKRMKNQETMYDDNEELSIFAGNIQQTLEYWTVNTYIGHKKKKVVQEAFQSFFEELYEFLLFCHKERNSPFPQLHNFADKALYHGTVYRYLGHCSEDTDFGRRVEPKYNNIYVSWSKEPDNRYIKSKLRGIKTFLVCNIAEPYYGIDLEAFEVSKAHEVEVVFPTIKNTITEIRYFQ